MCRAPLSFSEGTPYIRHDHIELSKPIGHCPAPVRSRNDASPKVYALFGFNRESSCRSHLVRTIGHRLPLKSSLSIRIETDMPLRARRFTAWPSDRAHLASYQRAQRPTSRRGLGCTQPSVRTWSRWCHDSYSPNTAPPPPIQPQDRSSLSVFRYMVAASHSHL